MSIEKRGCRVAQERDATASSRTTRRDVDDGCKSLFGHCIIV